MGQQITQYFADVQDMEIRDGLLFIGPGPAGNLVVLPLSAVRKWQRQVAIVLAAYDQLPDPVIPLCELCIRRGLPVH